MKLETSFNIKLSKNDVKAIRQAAKIEELAPSVFARRVIRFELRKMGILNQPNDKQKKVCKH